MNNLFYPALISLCLFLTQLSAYSQSIAPINQAQIAVEGRTQNLRDQAIEQGMKQTLVKLSGNEQINSIPEIQTILTHDADYLKSYRYTTIANDNGSNQLYINLTFDQQALYNQLTQAGQAIWPAERPVTLIWLNTDPKNSNQILAYSDQSSLEQKLITTAEQRGTPIVLPIMDLQDQAKQPGISNPKRVSDTNALLDRYHADAILIGKLSSADNQWQGKWQLVLHQQPSSWMNTSTSSQNVVIHGINQLANLYADQFSIYKSKALENHYLIQVNNINSLSLYSQVIHFIQQNPVIDKVNVNDMSDDTIRLTITTATNLSNLEQLLTQGNTLAAAPSLPHVDLTLSWKKKALKPIIDPNIAQTQA